MRDVITRYQNAVAGEILRFEGHVAKFMGDGVLAYFGWPMAHEDDAERALRAGLALVRAVGEREAAGGRSPPGSGSRPGWWWSATWSAKAPPRSRRWWARPRTLQPDC